MEKCVILIHNTYCAFTYARVHNTHILKYIARILTSTAEI